MTTLHRTLLLSVACCLLIAAVGGCSPIQTIDTAVTYPGTIIWTGEAPNFYTSDVSPDGHYFSNINWNTGDLDLVDLNTGEAIPLTGHGYDTGGYAWMSSFSSDGRRIACEWYNYGTGTHELRVHSLDEAESRLLVPADGDVFYVEPLDWSPSDQHIAVALRAKDGVWQLGLVSVEDGSIVVLKTLSWQAPGGGHPQAYPLADWSPDGQFIAYDYPSSNPENGQDIFALAVDGSGEYVLVEGRGSDRLLAWNADGSEILFYSDRSGSPSLWRLSVENGRPAGEPQLVASDVIGLRPIGQTEIGYAFGVEEGTWNTYTASIDFETGRILEEPQPVDNVPWHRNSLGGWSPDGSQLLYITFEPLPNPVEKAVFISVSGQLERELLLPRNFHHKSGAIAWISDQMVLLGGATSGQRGVHRLDLQTGEFITLPDFDERGFFRRFRAHPDGSKIYVVIDDSPPKIVAIDTRTGEHKIVTETQRIPASIEVSPDGDEIAYLTLRDVDGFSSIEAVNLFTGETRIIRREPADRLGQPLAWSADGDRILVGVRLEGDAQSLWSLSADGNGDPVHIDLPGVFGNYLSVNPDGEHIAFQSGIKLGSLRILEGF